MVNIASTSIKAEAKTAGKLDAAVQKMPLAGMGSLTDVVLPAIVVEAESDAISTTMIMVPPTVRTACSAKFAVDSAIDGVACMPESAPRAGPCYCLAVGSPSSACVYH